MSTTWRPALLSIITAAALTLPTTDIRAQTWAPHADQMPGPPPSMGDPATPRWQGHTLAFGANVALGAITAGVVRAIQGESFWSGFSRGGAGGGIAYLGKYMTTRDFSGARFLGRQTAAVGASISYNALTGRGTFETLTFPLGPVRLHHSPEGRRLTIDLVTVGGVFYALSRPGAELDLGRSLASASIVFRVDTIRRGESGSTVLGRAVGGVVIYREFYKALPEFNNMIIAHEMVHVLQHDYAGIALGSAFEGWLTEKLPDPVAKPLRYVDLGTYAALKLVPLAFGTNGRDTPWEREAYFLVEEASASSGSGGQPRLLR